MAIGKKDWPYVVGFAGVAALAYLWLAPRLIKPGIGMNYYGIGGKRAPLPIIDKAFPAMAGPMMGPHMGVVGMRNTHLVGESGGTIPVGGGPGGMIAGVTGGGGDFMYPSGVIGKPGGYGISGGYLGEAFPNASRLAVA